MRLRCHSCSHDIGETRLAMKLVGLFKASAFGRLEQTDEREVRRRCEHCGWVNIFHPQPAPSWRAVEVKA